MRIHITGMSPRQVSPRAREQVTFARSLEHALIRMGHEVYRGAGDINAELVIGGVTSALSPGSTYALIGLERIGRAMDEGTPLLLFVDDPDLSKTRAAAQSVLRSPTRMYSDYLLPKRVKESRVMSRRQLSCAEMAIETLAWDEWPPVLVPLHPWADVGIAAKRIGITSELIPIDVSAVVPLSGADTMTSKHADVWITEVHYSQDVLEQDRVRWPVIPIDSSQLLSPPHVYAVAKGVHQGAIPRMPGWWTPTPLYAAHARTVYLCDAEEGRAIGVNGPYYVTSDQVETLFIDDDDHQEFADAQAAHLKETMWDLRTLSSHLADSIGRVSSSAKPDGKRRTSPTS